MSRFSYAEAVRILGGETATLRALDKLLGGVLLGASAVPGVGATALSLFDAKSEAVRLGHQLITALREKVTGATRYTRSERLYAAQSIILATAFFESLDDIDLPFTLSDLELLETEKHDLFAFAETRIFTSNFPLGITHGHVAPERLKGLISQDRYKMYSDAGEVLLRFARGLAIWENLTSAQQAQASLEISGNLPTAASRRYDDMYRRLAVEFPEFAFWAIEREHHVTQEQLRQGLAGLTDLLASVSSGRVPPPKLRSLLTLNQAALTRPISPSDDLPDGLSLPDLSDGYVNPRFRVALGSADLSLERSWSDVPIRDDLQDFLAGLLTSLSSSVSPLLVLGQPGVGKSVLTQMIAARLPAADFLPIRVPLRQVPADAGIQEQIETAIRVSTGESMSWPDLVRSADGALPVVLLDGLDELLQATGVNRADYLVRAAEFQAREAELGRPVAVIVTTRTAVANRCRLPRGSLAIRLEPFSDDQVKLWIDTWNNTNGTHFAGIGREPLSYDDVLAHSELAEQPLLLLMLALYDASGPNPQGALRNVGTLSYGELYERLLHGFAAREIDKHEPGLPPNRREQALERELHRLSVAAFAMFNRGQQWVTHDDLDRDLTALIPEQTSAGVGFDRPLTVAQTVIGRFFFIHQSRALHDSHELSTYEFLHATFGEYLIARLVRDLLREEAQRAAVSQEGMLSGMFNPRSDPGPSGALLSFAVLSVRVPILAFLHRISEPGEHLRPFLLRRFQETYFGAESARSNYEPVALSATQRIARQTANLVLLTTVLTGPVTAAELFGADSDWVRHWQSVVDLWRAGTHQDEWPSLASSLRIARSWEGQERVLAVYWEGSWSLPMDGVRFSADAAKLLRTTEDTLAWAHNVHPATGLRQWQASGADTSLDTGADRSVNSEIFDSLYFHMRHAVTSIGSVSGETSTSVFTALNEVSIARERYYIGQGVLTAIYDRAFKMISLFPEESSLHLKQTLIHLARDLPIMTTTEGAALLAQALPLVNPSSMPETHQMVACLLNLVARDREQLEFLGQVLYDLDLPDWSYLEAAVTLMELDVDPSEVPVTAFDVVRRMRPDQLIDIERDHPHLFHRARRIIRADGGRYRLVWPT
ncbi:hypothetical protein Aple_056080 [Acrocarpospora pleiomorpha]|uniref:AAA+ ATPase domain-containing protein n=1 Tax=Acrocarpospora pleiomorpha TaxID=90975 RepID=A0A5M3XPB0_9ACTN|nr:hypothetical protein [Acrocarpospora pleiomorpha]GES22710.1 hypothetical protein Aple_056080 [Acrocarpospora pleiomorpha]